MLCMLLLSGICAAGETVRGDLVARFGNVPSIVYEGTEYRLRNRLTAILLAGVDQRGDTEAAIGSEYRSGGQADFQLLLVIDDNRDTVAAIQINRDTMAEITILGVLGQESGTRRAQICLAHSFGDGGKQSCELLVQAVSRLMMDVPIDHYAVMNLDGISALNDVLGGVEVTLEEDFSAYDPEMTAGKTLVLQGDQAEIFLRSRYHVGDQTNVSRLERQKAYIQAAADKLLAGIGASSGYANTVYAAIEPFLVTDMSKGRIVNLANSIHRYEVLPLTGVPGEAVLGAGEVMEFYPDEDALMPIVLDAFFEKKV